MTAKETWEIESTGMLESPSEAGLLDSNYGEYDVFPNSNG